MNKLSYGLLSFLSMEPMTGYDLTSKINAYWKSTHSAIYPLLAELEECGYVKWNLHKQNGKPDKKIYTMTDSGTKALNEWVLSETSDPVNRDEMVLKLFCIKRMDDETINILLNEFEKKCNSRVERFRTYIDNYRNRFIDADCGDIDSVFGSYIVVQRCLNHALMDLEWCQWVRTLLKSDNQDFLNHEFNKRGE